MQWTHKRSNFCSDLFVAIGWYVYACAHACAYTRFSSLYTWVFTQQMKMWDTSLLLSCIMFLN